MLERLSDSSTVVVTEATNAVIDVFADDGNDPAFRALNALAPLQQALPSLALRVRFAVVCYWDITDDVQLEQQKRMLGEMERQALEDAIANLEGFVQYKSS